MTRASTMPIRRNTRAGGNLFIVPVIGGSGPQNATSLPYSLGLASEARNALDVAVDLERERLSPARRH